MLLREEALKKLWRHALQENMTEEVWSRLAQREWRLIDELSREQLQPGIRGTLLDKKEVEQMWTFWGALLFCGTVYTTIGRFLWTFILENLSGNLFWKRSVTQ